MWNVRRIVSKGDYMYAVVPEHPNATKNGYVLEHRVLMENHLKRLLMKNEVVHHLNGNKKDNRISNLELLKNDEHVKKHQSAIGRSFVELVCPSCKKMFCREKRQTHLSKHGFWTACSNKCRGSFGRLATLHGRTAEVELAISENIVREYKIYSTDNPEQTETTGCVETIRQQSERTKI